MGSRVLNAHGHVIRKFWELFFFQMYTQALPQGERLTPRSKGMSYKRRHQGAATRSGNHGESSLVLIGGFLFPSGTRSLQAFTMGGVNDSQGFLLYFKPDEKKKNYRCEQRTIVFSQTVMTSSIRKNFHVGKKETILSDRKNLLGIDLDLALSI